MKIMITKWLAALAVASAILWPPDSPAQTLLPCNYGTSCPTRYYWETQPCADGVCARSSVPTTTEFSSGKGMMLSGAYTGVWIQLCAAIDKTLEGEGRVRLWTWAPWNPSIVSTTRQVDMVVSDVWTAGICASNTNCRCVHWTDWTMGGGAPRRVIAEAEGVTTSGGSSIEVRLVGLEAR